MVTAVVPFAIDLELDLTNAHLSSLEEIDLPLELEVLDLTANTLRHLDEKLINLPSLCKLCVRQNILKDHNELEKLKSAATMEELDVRDNQLEVIPSLSNFTRLRLLDFSYNQIRCLTPLIGLQSQGLAELYLACNKLSKLEGIEHLTSITLLELGSNRLKSLDGIESLHNLKELWVGQNRISEVGVICQLTQLCKLSLQSNRLVSLAGIQGCSSLEEVYLSHNGIESMEELDFLQKLRIVDVANNRIKNLEGLKNATHLTDVWANDNQVKTLEDVESALRPHADTLTCVYLYGCPCAQQPRYRLRMKHILPRLEQLDDKPVL